MRNNNKWLIFILVIAILLPAVIGCSGGGSGVTPGIDDNQGGSAPKDTPREATTVSNRYLLGYWSVSIDPVKKTWEIVAKRDVEFHADIRYFLQVAPCNNCLAFDTVNFLPNDRVSILVRIKHPFTDTYWNGFDVRAVPILAATLNFGAMGLSYGVLENPDGYTGLWDKGTIDGEINPYVAYNPGSTRRIFPANTSSSEWLTFNFSKTGWVFDYAVDASWDVPSGTTFPPTANAEEAYQVNASVTGDLLDDGTNTATVNVTAYDWQGQTTISGVTAIAPDLFSGSLTMNKISGSGNSAQYSLVISNNNLAPEGSYPVLIRVTDVNYSFSNDLRAYQLAWVHVVAGIPPPPGTVQIITPAANVDTYFNVNPNISITAKVTPVANGIPLQWWWTDPDEPPTDGAFGEGGQWETNTTPNDNNHDSIAGINGSTLIGESFPGPTPPAQYNYHSTTTNSSGISTISFKVSDYGGDNYEIHVRRTDTSQVDVSPIITVKRKVTLYKNAMLSSGGTAGYYMPDHAYMQTAYTPAYIDLVFQSYNINVPYQSSLLSDAGWLYSYAQGIYTPGVHQLNDVGANSFDDPYILGIAIYGGPYGLPLQQTILAVGRIREYYNPDALHENSVLIHEVGHNFGLDHAAQGDGVMEPACTGQLKFNRTNLTYLRADPAWE